MGVDNVLPAPTGLTAKGLPKSINHIEFTGDAASFEIWRRHGDTVDWYLHATTNAPSYEDSDVKPGQYYEYKVRAVSGESASEFSGSAVTYGAE
ncbi:MAG: hypothetical protein DMF63_06330 [Acidobacteria bacterium]|nr:MAG: hypothetical protein DMF63_06330 [Acidobacteriota bacterium]